MAETEAAPDPLQQAFFFLQYRDRSEHELRRYLARKGHDQQVIEETLAKLRDYHYVDDRLFAQAWVESRLI